MEWKKIYNRMHLLKCFFRGRYQISKEMISRANLSEDRVIQLAEQEIVNQFSSKVIKDYKYKIKAQETDGLIEFELDLFIIDKDAFITMVETCVSMMPQSEIDRIRNNNK